jgi:hypothetical protein
MTRFFLLAVATVGMLVLLVATQEPRQTTKSASSVSACGALLEAIATTESAGTGPSRAR